MAIPYGTFTELDQSDRPLLNDALNFVRSVEVDEVLAAMVPRLTVQQREAVGAHAVVAHVAVLLFPDSVEALVAELRESGLHVDMPVPSVVVSERLARRYGLAVESLPVTILHVRQNNSDTVAVEIFALPAASDHIAVRERAERNESHLALQLDTTDDVLIEGVHALLTGPGNLLPDGGGYNAFEDCTALYYRYPSGEISAIPYKRLELRVRGRVAVPNAGHDPAIRLLELMTGAWTTQAIAVAVEIGLIDCLSGPRIPVETKSIGTLAKRLGVDPDALTRLLRYLASIGVLAPAGDSYTLTEIGELLRHEAPGSLRPLALLYGGPFYQSFGALEHAVRTGREGFERLFGKGHFDYFAEHAELGELFNAGMAASAPMFEPVPGLVDVSDARVVVDIGGGTAELLSRFLTQAPLLRGVLLEREHVLDGARQRLTLAGCVDRCDFVAGDFTRSVPSGGDIYLLSRVLHDWDDEQCLTILRACAAVAGPGASLLLIERLLPVDATPSLAVAWDLHMLCNVGGRERTAAHYEKLLITAGFELDEVLDLPLGGSLLRARRLAD